MLFLAPVLDKNHGHNDPPLPFSLLFLLAPPDRLGVVNSESWRNAARQSSSSRPSPDTLIHHAYIYFFNITTLPILFC